MRWTARLDEVLRQLRRNGFTFAEIARVLGVSRSAVAGRLSRLAKNRRAPRSSARTRRAGGS
jgi:hypothetical protein